MWNITATGEDYRCACDFQEALSQDSNHKIESFWKRTHNNRTEPPVCIKAALKDF